MGFLTWLLAGTAAALLARKLPPGRGPALPGEAATAIFSAVLAGILATALDFGGWNELEWVAILFSFFCSLTLIAVYRIVKSTIIRTRPT